MQKEVYADNVDVNGEVHETVGENIRNGAKSPEAVAKALQSEDITFDMQALMNVLPFMDSTKKIVKVTLTLSNKLFVSDSLPITQGSNWVAFNDKVYGCIFGEINGNYNYNTGIRMNGEKFGIQLMNNDVNPTFKMVLYLAVSK